MSTYDNRLDALERRVTSLEIRRLHDETLAKDNTPAEQGHNLREVNENMTILLGVIGKQGQDIKGIKEDVRVVKERLEEHTVLLTQILARLPEKP